MQTKTYEAFELDPETQVLVDQCVKLGLLSDCVSNGKHPMLIFPDGEKICFDDTTNTVVGGLNNYLEGMIKSADMVKCGFANISDEEDTIIILSKEQAIALRNFISESAYPKMHEMPEIAEIFDELQKQVGV